MDYITLIGIIAGILGVALYLPQIIKTLQTKHAKDLSVWTYIIILVNDILWTFWGYTTDNTVVWIPNGIAISLSTLILVLKAKYG